MIKHKLIPGKLYSFQNMLCPEDKPVIGTFISRLGVDDHSYDDTFTKYKVLVGTTIRTADLFMYEITEL